AESQPGRGDPHALTGGPATRSATPPNPAGNRSVPRFVTLSAWLYGPPCYHPLNAAEGTGLSPGVPPGRGPSLRAACASPPRPDSSPSRLHPRSGDALRRGDGRPLHVGVPGRAASDGPAPPLGPGHGGRGQRV